MKIIKWIKAKYWKFQAERMYKKKIAALKKRDPHTYKNF